MLPGDEERWQQWINQAIFTKHGTFIEYQSVGRDVTKNKRKEEELKTSHDIVNQSLLAADQVTYLSILETNLINIISPFLRNMTLKHFNLTPREIQVANLVKNGKSSKEIAQLLNLSTRAIEFHRENIRQKLDLKNRKANLQSSLFSHS